ncbi:uridine transporter UriT [Corynebacterium cystitidis]|uniref:uridine transporter UriT n=1 Tax=Corynebacterium cystitidis TaxID=35757 RepID=UPI00211F0398|nr:MFS transporter [Corynebacterium cystitidis]
MSTKVMETTRRTTGTVGLVLALLSAILAFQLNASMLSPVLATMERELNATAVQIGVSQTAFFTAAALFSLVLPRWGDLIGRRKIMIGMLVVTALGSVVAALSVNVYMLFVARIIQGVSGPIVPMALIMLRAQMPDEKRYAFWMAVLTSVNGGIAGVDALAGGWLAANYGFRSVFWTMAVVAVLAIVFVRFGTLETRAEESQKMDWGGALALVVSLGAILTAFNELGKLDQANFVLVGILLVIGVVAFFIFWRIESTIAHPLVTTTYMKQRRTWGLLLTTVLTMTGIFAIMNGLVPNLAQSPEFAGLGADTVSWFTLTPYALAGLIMGPIAGKIAGKLGYLSVLRGGLVVTLLGIFFAMYVVTNTTPITLLIVSLWIGISYAGVCNIMLNGLGVVLSPKDNQGYLPGMNSGAFNIGAGLSFALLFMVNTTVGAAQGESAGYQAGMLTGAIIIVLALVASFLIPSPARVEEEDKQAAAAA